MSYRLITLACVFLIGCTPKYDKVKVGMTLAEVEVVLGKANHTSSSSSTATFNGKETKTSQTTCKYNDVGTFEFINDTLVSKTK